MSAPASAIATLEGRKDRLPWPRLGTLYIFSVPFLAGIATMRGESLALAGFNYTGFLWSSVLLIGVFLLLLERGLRPANRIHLPLAYWLVWLTLVGMSFLWIDAPALPQVREAVQMGVPVLMGVLAGLFVRLRERLEQLLHAFYYAVPVLWVFAVLWACTDFDEAVRLDVFVEKRALALTAVIVGGVYMAGLQREQARGWIGWILCLGVTVVTGSRMASLAMLLLPLLNPVVRNPVRKTAILMTIGLVGLAVYLTPTFQERFFGGKSYGAVQGEFDSAGRFDAWPLILAEALREPWFGHGIGTVQRFVPEVWPGVPHPHNDYLRVGYELGAVGVVLFVAVMIWQLVSLGRWVRRTDGVVQQAFAASWLALAVFLPIAFTDNPMTYTLCYMNPVFVLMGASYSVACNEQRGRLAPVRPGGFCGVGAAPSTNGSSSSEVGFT